MAVARPLGKMRKDMEWTLRAWSIAWCPQCGWEVTQGSGMERPRGLCSLLFQFRKDLFLQQLGSLGSNRELYLHVRWW